MGKSETTNESNEWTPSDQTEMHQLLREGTGYTLDEAIDHIGFGMFQIRVIVGTGLFFVADAMEAMLLSVLGPVLMCKWNLSSPQEAFITTIVFIGSVLGSLLWGYICDRYGRKKGLYLSVACVLLFGVLSSQAPSYAWILILRFMVGVGLSGGPQGVTIMMEMQPTKLRSRTGLAMEVFWAFGSIFAVAMAINVIDGIGWRWYLILVCIPVLLGLVFGIWMPESPRFLLTTGKYDETVELLEKVAQENKSNMPAGKLTQVEKNENRGDILDVVSRGWRLTTVMLAFIWFSASLSYYGGALLTTSIFQTDINGCKPVVENVLDTSTCRQLTNKDYIDLMWTSVAELPGILFAILLCEKLGRKNSLAIQFGCGATSFLLLLFCTSRSVSVFFLFAARCFSVGAYQLVLLYTAEVYPTNIRAVAMATLNMFARCGAMITPFLAQVLIKKSFYGVVSTYATLLFLNMVISLLLPIETKDKPLLDSNRIIYKEKNGCENDR